MHGVIDDAFPEQDNDTALDKPKKLNTTTRAEEEEESTNDRAKSASVSGTAGSTNTDVEMDAAVAKAEPMDIDGFGSGSINVKREGPGSANEIGQSATADSHDNEKTSQSGAAGSSESERMNGAPKNGNGSSETRGDGSESKGQNGEINNKNKPESETAKAANGSSQTSSSAPAASAPPPPPVLKGTLSFNLELKRHVIRGMWNYENSNALPAQRFELLRNLGPEEDPKELPKDGEFHGSFSLAYFHTTSKGKRKERSKVIPESGVRIKFTKVEGKEEFNVDGQGTNQFGIFNINGSATPSKHEGDPTYNILLRKRYAPSQMPSAPPAAARAESKKTKKTKKRKHSLVGTTNSGEVEGEADADEGPLPAPSQSYPSHVVCLRGKLNRDQSDELGVTEVVHRINGMWSSGLDLILADPQNVRGLCNRFEYEHKSTLPNNTFPVSGRYSGWFDLTNEDASKTRINEKDITLKFRKNNAGYHNVEGRGSNAFGKYSITGTLTQDNVITIFRHFQPRKQKNKTETKSPPATTSGSGQVNTPGTATTEPPVQPEPQLKLEEVVAPPQKDGELLVPTEQPAHGTYSAVSRGILRLNADGAHTCNGKWAMTREHFNNGTTSNFAFRLEPHFAAQGAAAMRKASGEAGADNAESTDTSSTGVSLSAAPPGSMTFPIDSAMYKGSFQMKRGTTKYTSVIDKQIVLKFRKNTKGAFNVYGSGVNSIGVFNLVGTLILSGKGSGHVELYRMYPVTATPPTPKPAQNKVTGGGAAKASVSKPTGGKAFHDPTNKTPGVLPTALASSSSVTGLPPPPQRQSLARRESSRLVKLPSRLEDDDPEAQIARLVEKCGQVLKFMREKDAAAGQFFSQPVDPVAQRIPTYHEVISEPMDLGTVQSRFDAGEITTPEEFGRLVRLVFENAMTFNIEPTHVVHQAARELLILFNQKFRDIERVADNIRRTHKMPGDSKKKKGKDDKKRKSPFEEVKSQKRTRLDEAQFMASANATAMANLTAAAPQNSSSAGPVSRAEFNLMLQMIKQLQGQVVQTYTLLANLSPDSLPEEATPAPAPLEPMHVLPEVIVPPPAPAPEKRKTSKKSTAAAEKAAIEEDKPLTLQEQEVLTETINNLPGDKLPGVIQIIRESAQLGGDEDEIDLEIDQLDTATQRKLQRYVNKVRNLTIAKPFWKLVTNLLLLAAVREASKTAEIKVSSKEAKAAGTEEDRVKSQEPWKETSRTSSKQGWYRFVLCFW